MEIPALVTFDEKPKAESRGAFRSPERPRKLERSNVEETMLTGATVRILRPAFCIGGMLICELSKDTPRPSHT